MPIILIRLKGVANDEAGDEDDRVIVVLQGPLEKLNWDSANPKTEEDTRDYWSPKSEADPLPARTLISSTVHRT